MKGLYKIITLVGNIIILNFMFVLSSVLTLGFGLGTSISALISSFLDFKTDNSGYYVTNYLKHFKNNFKQSITFNLAIILLSLGAYLNFLMINTISNPTFKLIMLAILVLFILEVFLVSSFIFPVIGKFYGKNSQILYLSFMFAHKYLHISLLFVLLLLLAFYLVIYVGFGFIFVIFGLIYYLEALILKKIWKDYDYEVLEI